MERRRHADRLIESVMYGASNIMKKSAPNATQTIQSWNFDSSKNESIVNINDVTDDANVMDVKSFNSCSLDQSDAIKSHKKFINKTTNIIIWITGKLSLVMVSEFSTNTHRPNERYIRVTANGRCILNIISEYGIVWWTRIRNPADRASARSCTIKTKNAMASDTSLLLLENVAFKYSAQ